MLIGSNTRRVAILGGVRTPFARSHTAYAGTDNQELLTAALRALVERYRAAGRAAGRCDRRRRHQASQGLQPDARIAAVDRSRSADAGTGRAARLRHQPRGGHSGGQQDRAGPDRCRHRRRRRRPERSAGRLSASRFSSGCCAAPAAAASGSASSPGSDCDRATSNRCCRRWSSRAPACRWVRAAN